MTPLEIKIIYFFLGIVTGFVIYGVIDTLKREGII